jgi:hypothetical protein
MAPNDRINELVPRWDESRPTKYNYDPNVPYDRADYERFRKARQEYDQKRQKQAERELRDAMKDVSRAIMEKMDEELEKVGIPREAREGGGVLEVDCADSKCFSSVTWEPDEDDPETGVVTGVFRRDNSEYSGDMLLEDFLDFAADSSPGGYYNSTKPF